MAISIVNGNRGNFTNKASSSTWAIGSPSGTLATGNYGLLAIVVDNPGTQEGATTDISITDSNGNTWTRLREQTEANTAAGTGTMCALFLSSRLTENLTTLDTLSAAFNSQNVTAKGAGLAELSVAAGKRLVLSSANGSNGAAQTTYSVALSSLRSIAGLYLGMSACEDEVDGTVTLDAAYTVLGFGSIGSGTAGTPQTNVRARIGSLANTSTGDTFNATVTAGDRATLLVRLEEMAEYGSSVSAYTLSLVTAGTYLRRGASTLPLALGLTSAGLPVSSRQGRISWAHFESPESVPGVKTWLTWDAVTAGYITHASARVVLPFAVQIASTGIPVVSAGYGAGLYSAGVYGGATNAASSLALTTSIYTDGVIPGGGVVVYGAVSYPVTLNAVTQGYINVYVQPLIDSVDGAWTDQDGGSNLFGAIDEDVASDGDYIRSELNPTNSSCRVKLETANNPNSSLGHKIHWRPSKDGTGGQTVDMVVTLHQGGGDALGAGSVIASFNRDNVDAWTTYTEELSSGEAAGISDYSDLYLEFEATVV